MIATAGPSLTSTLSQVTTYFFTNVPTVIAAFLGVVVFMWMLKMAMASLGIHTHGDFLDAYLGADENGIMPSEESDYQRYAYYRDRGERFRARYEADAAAAYDDPLAGMNSTTIYEYPNDLGELDYD